jgi:hypothetical protein
MQSLDHTMVLSPGHFSETFRGTDGRPGLLPDRSTTVSTAAWMKLQRFVADSVVDALVGPIGCPMCVDKPFISVTMQFKAGPAKSVTCAAGECPNAIGKLLTLIDSLPGPADTPQKPRGRTSAHSLADPGPAPFSKET